MMLAAPRFNPPPQRLGLGWFVLISLSLHGVLLGLWPEVRPLNFGETADSTDTLTLKAVIRQPAVSTEKPAVSPLSKMNRTSPLNDSSRTTPSPKSTTRPTAVTAKSKQSEHRPEQSQQESPILKQQSPQQATAATVAEARRRLLGLLQVALSDHFHYPVQARRLGWQGTVMLGFRITPDRRIEAIRVKQSSGYRLLDQAAVEALDKVKQLPLSNELHLASAQDLTLPVIYHIKER